MKKKVFSLLLVLFMLAGMDTASAAPAIMGWPTISKNVTSEYGYRYNPIYKNYELHKGIDIGARSGSNPIYASYPGTVFRKTEDQWRGKYIDIKHYVPSIGKYVLTRYQHLASYQSGVNVGSSVGAGHTIGQMGMTGDSTGVHLHFETMICSTSSCSSVSVTNPRYFLNEQSGPIPLPNSELELVWVDYEDTLGEPQEEKTYSYDEVKNMTPEERKEIGIPDPYEEFK